MRIECNRKLIVQEYKQKKKKGQDTNKQPAWFKYKMLGVVKYEGKVRAKKLEWKIRYLKLGNQVVITHGGLLPGWSQVRIPARARIY